MGGQIARRGEDDGAVQLFGLALPCSSYPCRAQVACQLLMARTAGVHVHLAALMEGYLDDYVGGSAEPVEAEPAAGPCLGKAQCPVSDDAGAEQWRCLAVGVSIGYRICEVLGDCDVLCVAAVHVVPGEAGVFAQVFLALLTGPALPAGGVEPGYAYAVAGTELRNAFSQCVHGPDDLVSRYDWHLAAGDLPLDGVKVGVADAAGGDTQPHLVCLRRRRGHFGVFQRAFPDGTRPFQDHRLHSGQPP